jgi:hypothetical protein
MSEREKSFSLAINFSREQFSLQLDDEQEQNLPQVSDLFQ